MFICQQFYSPEGDVTKGRGLFGNTHMYGGYDSGQTEYACVPYADFGPIKFLTN